MFLTFKTLWMWITFLTLINSNNVSSEESQIYSFSSETVREPFNSNTSSRYIELVLVFDHSMYVRLAKNATEVHQYSKDLISEVTALFMPLNIFIALVGVEFWTEKDEITIDLNPENTLRNFLEYRKNILLKKFQHDNAQLVVGKYKHFENGVMAKVLIKTICSSEYGGGVSIDMSSNKADLYAYTIAHAIGHNLGLTHDVTPDCICPDEKCIMSPSITNTPTHWSSCSFTQLSQSFKQGLDHCLQNIPANLFGGSTCGNGFLEPNEECDCGLESNCENKCCNANTCTLKANATCASGRCCNFETCQWQPAGVPCRLSNHECDISEFCTGGNEFCPDDIYKTDGEVCDEGKSYCYNGKCQSHYKQCQLLWGKNSSNGIEECYKTNKKGSMLGNCGKINDNTFVKCTDGNELCGKLHCDIKNDSSVLHYGLENTSIIRNIYVKKNATLNRCVSAIFDLGHNSVDPGLVPNGVKCADGKMCVNQKCVPVDNVRKKCSDDCFGHGICTNTGICSCENGYNPPNCQFPISTTATDTMANITSAE